MTASLLYDPAQAIAELRRADRRLARHIDRIGPFTLVAQPRQHPFRALLRAIIYQQLSGRAAASIHARVAALLPDRRSVGAAQLLALPEGALRGAGLSAAKVRAVRDLAEKTLAGVVPNAAGLRALDDEEIVARLTTVRGVGRWTVEMLLLFSLGRPDVMPSADLGIRKGFMSAFGTANLPAPADIEAHAERWRPFRSVASWYLWRIADTVTPAVGRAKR
ncbi:MAG TPA: DNA-3-methyladenine glycosylase 2 family protein [Gammaproteobacteria bacterium]|nr:DNA-3-methyladenine glycosylase 2 family protein [Gammaproteobacteria bacterium]